MNKEKWKKCSVCQIFTDPDEKYCPQYGRLEKHGLQEVWLRFEDIIRLNSQRRIFTKHHAALEARLFKQKRPA